VVALVERRERRMTYAEWHGVSWLLQQVGLKVYPSGKAALATGGARLARFQRHEDGAILALYESRYNDVFFRYHSYSALSEASHIIVPATPFPHEQSID